LSQYDNMEYVQLLFGNMWQNFILEVVSALLTRTDVPVCNSGVGSCLLLACTSALLLDFLA